MVSGEGFSIATLIYARLRRVSGRVIDAMYLAENINYAKYVIELAEQTKDDELTRLIHKLKMHMNLPLDLSQDDKVEYPMLDEAFIVVEPTEDDIYKAQVSHRYIGALR
mgnify:CR=1 FL=1